LKRKIEEIYFEFLTLDKMGEIRSHVIDVLCECLVPHVSLALCQTFHDGYFTVDCRSTSV